MTKFDSLELFWRPIVNQYFSGATALPPFLGLEEADYLIILKALGISDLPGQHQTPTRLLRRDLLAMRADEVASVFRLLESRGVSPSRPVVPNELALMSRTLSAACMGSAHLWKDTGLPERPRLSMLFEYYYPELKVMNNKNMRWKRFVYKQLCKDGGDYVCRAPSCETCSSFHECFLPEGEAE